MIEQRNHLIELYEKYHEFLTQTQRQNFYLYYFQDLSLQEVSEIVATTRVAVHDSLQKACKKLEDVAQKMEGK